MVTNNAVFFYRSVFLNLLFIAFLSNSEAQNLPIVTINGAQFVNTHPNMVAAHHIKTLKEGVLVVRLQTKRKKIEALEKMVEKSEKGSKDEIQLTKMLDELKFDRKTDFQNMLQAIEQNYFFSDYVFMHDYESRLLKSGEANLFDSRLGKVTKESLVGKEVYVLSWGSSEYNSSDVLEVLDGQLKKVPEPFPGTIGMSFIKRLFSSFGSVGFYNERIYRLNRKLERAEARLVYKGLKSINEKYLVPVEQYNKAKLIDTK